MQNQNSLSSLSAIMERLSNSKKIQIKEHATLNQIIPLVILVHQCAKYSFL